MAKNMNCKLTNSESQNTELILQVANSNISNFTTGLYNVCVPVRNISRQPDTFDANGEIRITLYSLIFILAVAGNTLVILTLVQNRRMRTVTNVFLLNLSIADLLLAVFCMPFTLIPLLLRDFIFGEVICVAVRYLQAVSVGVSCFTLVTISSERYFAICQPLRSRRWQTLSHSYKIIIGIWIGALSLMIPIASSAEYRPLKSGGHACREIWADTKLEIAYSIILDVILLVIPLFVMGVAYGLIIRRLWIDIKLQDPNVCSPDTQLKTPHIALNKTVSSSDSELRALKGVPNGTVEYNGHISLRQTNSRSNVNNRKRVIKMLFVIVLEYFMCWTPLYVVNTWKIVDYVSIHVRMPNVGWGLILLLAYTSSFIHPITYCFMNKNFRKGFLSVFKCFKRGGPRLVSRHGTEVSSMPSLSQSPIIKDKMKMEVMYAKVSPDD